jgi:uncharacterized repeat protein (TIGR03803 family)
MSSRISKSDPLRVMVTAMITSLLFGGAIAAAQTYTSLYAYPGTDNNTSGITWPGLMSQGQDGAYYGTIQTNGAFNAGSVYKMTTNGAYGLIYSFCAEGGHCTTTGSFPDGGVTLGTDGNFYGTTQDGGANGDGTVFKITPGSTLTTLWNFTEGLTSQHLKDEGFPWYPPLLGQDGNFYGVDSGGYNTDYGVFYKMTSKGALTPHQFVYTNGAGPNLAVQSTDGNFYGTTQLGGDPTCKCGVVYKATAAGKITVLHAFKGYPTDGNRPLGMLVQGTDGNFYGTTYNGGAKNIGTLFKITPAGAFSLLYSFNGNPSDGALPWTGMTLATDGNLYGVTAVGGTKNAGVVYKLTPAGNVSILYNFCTVSCYDGIYPETPIMQHTDGKFYGNTAGNSLGGAVFYSFDTGLGPFAKLVIWEGKVGATAEILGQGLTGTSSVSFNGTPATFTVVSDTYLTAKVPVGANTGSVSVVTSGGTLTSSHIFLVTPTIKTISPTSGPIGTVVTITGTGLTQTTKVTFGRKTGTFTVNSDSQITATVPSTAKTGKIVVTTPGGTATSSATFTVTP